MPVILTYHHIGDPAAAQGKTNLFVSAPRFEEQLIWLKRRNYRFVLLDEVRAGLMGDVALPPRAVALTFDDGFLDNYESAFPLLRRHGAAATFFVTTGPIGAANADAAPHMTSDQLRELDRAGMAIGSHTVSHARLARLDPDAARRELAESKARLESILEKPVRWLCYPRGSFNREVATMAKQLGYVGACSVIRDNQVAPEQMYWLPRAMVMRGAGRWRFAYYFHPLYHFIHARKNRRRWKEYLHNTTTRSI
ncbi:MAG: polysaccharide deacetylase family protein [Candidatus Sumerlaeota bacterium]|nr:polysaccharide deacetylase family protein [Candidatus Sumerlaeota bacterium]